MSVTVTIHKGELAQIKRLIEQKKAKKGQLYGLWTHSFQPVIQYVIGEPKPGDEKNIRECLQETHFLQHLGNWSNVGESGNHFKKEPSGPSFVKMTVELVDDKTIKVKSTVVQKSSHDEKELDGLIEELEGDSAFRLVDVGQFESREFDGGKYHHRKVPGAIDLMVIKQTPKAANEAETKGTQWYSTEDGMKLFGMIHGAFQSKFEITGTSRDTKTHDISITVKRDRREYTVDFPSNFPVGRAVFNDGRKKRKISLTETETEGKVKSNERGQQQGEKNKGSSRKRDKKAAVGPEEEAPNKNDDESAGEGSPGGGAAVPQEQPSSEKVPELLVKGILELLKDVEGTRV